MLRDYNIARGNLSAYNVHGVTALQPHPLDTPPAHACADVQDIGEMWARVARSSAAPHLKRGLLTTKTTSLLQLMPVDDTLLTNWPPLDPPLLSLATAQPPSLVYPPFP